MSKVSSTKTPSSPQTKSFISQVTLRSILWGIATAAILNIYSNYAGMVMGSSSLVKSQYSMAMLLSFTLWLFVNISLKFLLPRSAFTSTELLVIYTMGWIAGNIPMEGWAAYWTTTVAVPTYYVSPENRWGEVIFDILPWWALAEGSPDVIRPFYDGLTSTETIPWVGWVKPIFWVIISSLAVLTAGICLCIIFQRQWEDAERLTYPLGQFAVSLTSGFDEPARIPKIFRNKLFWAGFFIVFGVFLWNIVGYFAIGLPKITIYDGMLTKRVDIARNFPSIFLRILPPVVGLTYFCNLDILLSFWVLRLLAILKIGVMDRTGFAVGLTGQQAQAKEIIFLESHGAMVLLALWSIWIARGHLKKVWRAALMGRRSQENDGIISYRIALLGFLASTIFIVGWMRAIGLSFPLALLHTLLLYIAYLVAAKFTAASGFSYIFPIGGKGGSLVKTFVGTTNLTRKDLVGIGLINSSFFFGNTRIPAWPALPHHFKLLGNYAHKPSRLAWMAELAFLSGLLASFLLTIYLAYSHGGQNLHTMPFRPQGGSVQAYNSITNSILEIDRTVFDPGKISVWLFGFFECAFLVLLRNRLPWWPLHPLGLVFQNTTGPNVYSFSMFLTWSSKLILLRIGGISLYRRAAPFFIALPVGYVSGVFVSSIVDFIWFKTGGHWVHGW